MKTLWLQQSIIALCLTTPVYLALGFMEKNYGVKSDIFLIWYFLGVACTPVIFGGHAIAVIMPSWRLILVILLIGLLIGGVANVMAFRAVNNSPNPGLPIAIISGGTSMCVFLASALLAKIVPSYFNNYKFDAWSLIGIILVIAGITIIVVRK